MADYVDLLEYSSVIAQNREIFLLKFGNDFGYFQTLLELLHSAWSRIGQKRDPAGHSHVGLTPFVNLLTRQCTLGFQYFVSYQSYQAWLTFRPGFEAFLLAGKFIDDPRLAVVWKNRNQKKNEYIKAFRDLTSMSIDKSSRFKKVLTLLNDNYSHPNPDYIYRDIVLTPKDDKSDLIQITYTDQDAIIHEAHLLAYLNLAREILFSSAKLINQIFNTDPSILPQIEKSVPPIPLNRITSLARENLKAKTIMENYGLLEFTQKGKNLPGQA